MMQMPNTQPDFRALCAEFVAAVGQLTSHGDSPAGPGHRLILTVDVDELEELATRARAALAAEQQRPVLDVRFEFSVFDGEDEWQAGGDAPTLQQAKSEGVRYLAHYAEDDGGPYRLELRRVEVLP